MTRTLRILSRRNAVESLSFETRGARDGEGNPAWGAATAFEGRAVAVDEFIAVPEGTQVRITLDVYSDPGEPFPARGDRVTRSGQTYIVESVPEMKTVRSSVFVQVARCRDE